MTDPYDIPAVSPPGRIYSDDTLTIYAVVDPQDMVLTQHRWLINNPHPTRNGKKKYFRRSRGSGRPGKYQSPLYLHVEIMKRTGIPPPTKQHKLVDHIDGNEWNCRRSNLAWSTHAHNNSKRNGGAKLVEAMA